MSENVAAGARRRRLKREGVSPRKSERTRQAILDAALEFLWTQPFRELTVGELMVMAEASRPAFYQYFTDLHQVMEVLLDDLRDEIMSVAAPWLIAEGDPVPLLRESLTGLVKVCYRRGPILRAVADAASADATLEKELARVSQGLRRCGCRADRTTAGRRPRAAAGSASHCRGPESSRCGLDYRSVRPAAARQPR